MPTRTVHLRATPAEVGEALADHLLGLVRAKPDAVIGLATGATPEPLYDALAERAGTAFRHARFVALDEYVGLPEGSPLSFAATLWRQVLGPVGADPGRVFLPDGRSPDRAAAAAAYEAQLERLGGVDLWLLGLGRNGHVAFNEPGSAERGRTRDVVLTASTREANAAAFGSAGAVPDAAITVGLGTLREHARELALMVTGGAKAEILARAWKGPETRDVPASLLRGVRVTGWFDEAAASLL
ncbi:glucosamine-6-phosphate deaminase [Parvularcula dongshanensis]|uniref:Glucosamine-6-phosphate deaminase n=1 Tax=Parvularcula dongshanensis TaxID=1173995 RepID=A0A840I1R7_9PROT|nr:glucosamine-6-phosphate deaminase [Parvularcula dongshanensis]MBB4658184.1 glucosamine-6-phosphate deaminase [Parvularcula dongshanensis]